MFELIGFVFKLGEEPTGQKSLTSNANDQLGRRAYRLCVLQVDMGQSDIPRVRVAGRKEEERIASLKVRGGGRKEV